MLEEKAGVMRNAMTTRAPCGAKELNFWTPESGQDHLGK